MRVAGRLIESGRNTEPGSGDEPSARQLLVWGTAGQRRLRDASVAVVGVGGTGSHVAIQLAHLGIGRLALVDPDVVEASNLGRLVGATANDVGRPKVEVLALAAAGIRPEIVVEPIVHSVLDLDADVLASKDLIVCCTDGHGSRALLTELAAQYLVTLIDLGVEVQSSQGSTRAGGGVRIVRPGAPCLHCMNVLDSALVREEFLSDAQRDEEEKRGYLRGSSEPAPSVIALNGVIASLAVVEVLNELLGLFAESPRRLLYRAEARSVTTADATGQHGCYVCRPGGITGLGDARRLPRRQAEPRRGSG
ncbi:MAG: ThiF family adenylyltransferase [Actinobacteria bacterium]|nr:ThiF family adenylyltransferase [Actinomycetota bacterium]